LLDRNVDEFDDGLPGRLQQFCKDTVNRFIPLKFALKLGIAPRTHKDMTVTSFMNGKYFVPFRRKFPVAFTVTFAPEKEVAGSILKCLPQSREKEYC
jgi:hypothetical protein